jgi:uncharacterized protein GlcG (DUF336 family)
MPDLQLTTAQAIISHAHAFSRRRNFAPMTVVVLDARGIVKAAGSEDGSSLSRFEIARGKAFGCLAFDLGARALLSKAQPFINAVGQLHGVSIVPVPGGVLVRLKEGTIIGAVGISGDTSEHDEEAAVAGIEAAGLVADTGASG